MEVQLHELSQESKKIGLNIHKGKNKMHNRLQSDETIEMENEIIGKVDWYKYMGQTVIMETKNGKKL